MTTPNDIRRATIVARRAAGETLQAIADDYGVTRQRIQQIVGRDAPEASIKAKAVRAERTAARHRALAEAKERREAERTDPRVLYPSGAKSHRSEWTDARMLSALLNIASRKGSTPVVTDVNKGGPYSDLAPTAMTYIARFGSWNNALVAAGLDPNPTLRRNYDRKWPDEAIINKVAEFINYAIDNGLRSSVTMYQHWADKNDAPSNALVKLRLGTWNRAKALALASLTERGNA